MPDRFRVEIAPSQHVTALRYPAAPGNRAGVTLILGHGAGANQTSGFMVAFAAALAERGIDTITFNFLYSEQGRRVPDPNAKLEGCWRRDWERARRDQLRRRKAGARRQVHGRAHRIAGCRLRRRCDLAGLVFLGYPLHPPGRPDRMRAAHLREVKAPMLFVQGSRDTFGTPAELKPIVGQLEAPAD